MADKREQNDINGGIIRWEQLSTLADKLRSELAKEIIRVEVSQGLDHEEITKMRTEIASLKTEMRIMGIILLALLVALVGLVVDSLVLVTP